MASFFEDRIAELEELILHHKKLYYQGRAELSDLEYDKLEEELKSLKPNSKVLEFVGYSLEVEAKKIKHEQPMLSLDKTRNIKDLISWSKNEETLLSYKMDGSSASLVFNRGKFILAKTRGDGEFGENITKHLDRLDFPKELTNFKDFENIEIRGEVCISKQNFEKLKQKMKSLELEEPKSIRNIVAGLLHKKEDLFLCSYLDFIAYEIFADNLNINTEKEKYEFLENNGFKTPYYTVIDNSEKLNSEIEKYAFQKEDYLYLTDGLVLSINNLDSQKNRGFTLHHPKGKMAFKFQAEAAESIIRDIIIDVGRTGKLSFVGIIDPVFLSGAKVSRVTLHNYKYIIDNKINIGAKIELIRSGEVIPKHEKTILENGSYIFPKNCPICHQELTLSETEVDLLCLNENCKAQIYGRILHWTRSLGMDSLGDETLTKFYETGMIKNIPDLYKLKLAEIAMLYNQGYKSAANIINSIEATKKISLLNFLTAVGLSGFGKGTVKLITEKYSTLEQLKNIKTTDLLEIKGIGEVLAENITQGLKEFVFPLYQELQELGFEILTETKNKAENLKLENKKLVITGTLFKKRKEIIADIENHGGKVIGSVSSNTDYLVCNNPSNSSKFKKAEELAIPIISEEELYQLME